MDISVDINGAFSVAKLSGGFDHADNQKLADELQPLVAESGARLAIEMSALNQINSAGLSELIGVVTRARLCRSRVVLVSPSAFVRHVLDVTRLDGWFDIVENVTDARSALEG